MSVKGFNVGSGVEKYDYNALDNLPDSEEYTASEKTKLGALPTKAELDAELETKVDTSDFVPITAAQIQALFGGN